MTGTMSAYQTRPARARADQMDRTLAALLAGLGRLRPGLQGCCFTFHRLADPSTWAELPNRGFHLDESFLDTLLGHLIRTGWDVVTMQTALERAGQPGGRRFVNFSIDDCYRDTFERVVPLFRRHGVPVTLFVTTGIPDGTLPLWGAGLETILQEQASVTDGRVFALTGAEARRDAYAQIAAAWDGPQAGDRYHAFCQAHGYDAAGLDARHAITWDMLAALKDDKLVEIGAHTVSHPRISSLPAELAMHEIAGSRARLQGRLGIEAAHFAFPYGRQADCGARDFDLVRAAGFSSAATTRKGLVRRGQDPFAIPRNTLNGVHRSLLMAEAHLSGALALAARVTGRV